MMENTELINRLRDVPCWAIGTETEETMHAAANALEADEQRIDGLQKLVDINTERCEALRKQLREAHESYEKHINELEAKIPKEGEWIEVHDWINIPQEERGTYRCSACGQVMKYPWNYCPNCGARNIAAESEADADYQLSVLMQEYFERYEPTYNSEDGSM